jgi:hypothetical protein
MSLIARILEPSKFDEIEEFIPSIGRSRLIKRDKLSKKLINWIESGTTFSMCQPHSVDGEKRFYYIRTFEFNSKRYFIQYYLINSEHKNQNENSLHDTPNNRKVSFFLSNNTGESVSAPPVNINLNE